MPELIAPDWGVYEQTALRIARDPALADHLKAKLAENLKTAPAFNTAAFTRALEDAYTGLVRP
jgi:predicted O-linked N-acetylglucosamine transferase (SPINDLY family)